MLLLSQATSNAATQQAACTCSEHGIYARCCLSYAQVVHDCADPTVHVNVNGSLIPFETDLFKGHMALHFKGLPSTDAGVFAGKKRTVHNVIQVSAASCCHGGMLHNGPSVHDILSLHTAVMPCQLFSAFMPVMWPHQFAVGYLPGS